jgi:hypothetical protein
MFIAPQVAMQITACFITRNHAHCLPAALESLRGVTAEILIADAGSTDATITQARDFGAKIVPLTWADDFSAACNAAFAAAMTPWILWLNPDETLAPTTTNLFAKATEAPDVLGYGLRVQQQLHADKLAYGTADYQWRLFRKHEKLKLQGRAHPEFTTSIPELAPHLGMNVQQLDAIIIRHAYHSEVTPDKIRWTNSLLQKELSEHPERLGLRIEWGRNLLTLGDAHGHEVLASAATLLLPKLLANNAPPPDAAPLVEYLLTVSPELNRGPMDRLYAARVAFQHYYHTPPILWALAGDCYQRRDFATAVSLLTRLLELNRTGAYDRSLGFDPAILGRDAMLNLGMSHLQLQHFPEAIACFKSLTNDPTHGPRAQRLLMDAENSASAERKVQNAE